MAVITALLGPTNTGKTHRAIERMLEHGSGMLGLPLRLLAREVYDKVSARVGESRVALVTGEEQRVPRAPSYWIATVEAMPVDRSVEFVGVDEVQLAAHEQRGHVFTSRILGARGTKETWFLGAGTMRSALRELVPHAEQIDHPRLSRLTFAGAAPLAKIPPRSALVAFSMTHVYELAERLRVRKGGAAVVLGALSPRTRNAQVAMFQAGEVDYLVATDAVGMGLNLDVDHVAFAATRKFDGRVGREVDEAELGQIAGRAGRWVKDGTFGTLAPIELPHGSAAAIELHRFGAVKKVRWRSDDLSFASLDALRESLATPPRRGILTPTFDADDAVALALLAVRPHVARFARSPDDVRLLWEVCSIPDFRKLLLEVHVEFLDELFCELASTGKLSDDWIAARIDERPGDDDDVDTLVARIAATRTWTYVTNRKNFVPSAREWQEKTRALEDALSDRLHERLVARFVDVKNKRRSHSARTTTSRTAPAETSSVSVDPAHPFAKLAALRTDRKAIPAPPVSTTPSWVDEVVDARPEDLTLTAEGRILHVPTGRAIAEVARGASLARPDVHLLDLEVGAGARSRLLRRMLATARDVTSELTAHLAGLEGMGSSPALRAFLHRFEQGLGTMGRREMHDLALEDEELAAIAERNVHFGVATVHHRPSLWPAAIAARIAIASIYFGARRAFVGFDPEVASVAARGGTDPRAYTAIGYPVFGGRAIRADLVEALCIDERDPIDAALGTLGPSVGTREAARIVAALREVRHTPVP